MKSLLRGFWLILTLDCEQSARLTSESFDRTLTWAERLAVRAHNSFCKKSRNLARQLRLLNRALQHPANMQDADEVGLRLSQQAKERIAATIRDAL